jgi:tetratricopeptide (TPR) repeat protein
MGRGRIRRRPVLPALAALWLLAVTAATAVAAPAAAAASPAAAAAVGPEDCIQLFDGRSFDGAQACLEAFLAKRPADAVALAYLGRACLERRQAAPAIGWLEQAAARDPGRSEVHDWLGRAYGIAAERAPRVRQFGLAVKARKEFARAVELAPGNLEALEDLIEFQIQAPAFLGGSFDQARLHAAEIERRDPPRGRLARDQIRLRQLGLAAAERQMQATAADFPGDPRPRLALGAAYGQAGRYQPAFEALEAALRLDPGDVAAAVELAQTATLSGQRLDRAAELLTACLKRLPAGDSAELADCHYQLGALLERRGEPAAAREHYAAALRLDPGLTAARVALRRRP